MIIAYDVSHIGRHRAGIGRLATIQLRGLLSADRKRTYILHGWAPDLDAETLQSFVQSNVRLSVAKLPSIVKRLHWNYLRFPPISAVIGDFNIFHCSEPLLPPLGTRHAIISFNDSAYYRFPHFYSRVTARKWDYLYRRAVQTADIITVLSENTRCDLIDIMAVPPEKVHVVRPPTDPVFSKPRSKEEELRVRRRFGLPEEFLLFVGTIEPRKNIPRLVKAFEIFAASQKGPISLVIVGRRGWLYEDVLRSINSSPARAKILLLDYVDDNELAILYRLAIMLVFPSLYEGHGYPVVEAMASGTPVITSDNSSLKEIGEGGAALLIDPENVAQLSDAIQEIYNNQHLRADLSHRGRQRASAFSVENAVRSILQLYDSFG